MAMTRLILQYEEVRKLEATLLDLALRAPQRVEGTVGWSLEWVAAMDKLIAAVYDAGKAAA